MASRPRNRRRWPLFLEELEPRRLLASGGSISGVLYTDVNGLGAADSGEPALPNWTVFLDTNNNGVLDPGEPSATTDTNGNYSFTGLAAGTYHVREVLPAGWQQTTKPQDVQVGNNQAVPNINLGSFQQPTISGQVFQDLNGSGSLAAGDTGLSGWTVFIDANGNGILDTGELNTTTDANGNYSFPNLSPGNYRVREVTPTGWVMTTTLPADIQAQSGVNTPGVNLGDFQKITLGGEVFNDTNGNGVLDTGESLLKQWGVFLDTIGSDGKVHGTIPGKTDDNGNFSYTDLGPGTYQVREGSQPGYVQSGSNPAPVTAQSGTNVSGLNLAAFQTVRLTGRVYNDLNNSGNDNGGADPGLTGVKIQLYQDTKGTGKFDPTVDNLLSTVSSASGGPQTAGQYAFNGVGPGQYFVVQVSQLSLRQTSPSKPTVWFVQPQSGTTIDKLDFGDLSGADQIFVDQLYRDLLHRPADGAALSGWGGQLDAGTLTRAQLVQQIEQSTEYQTDVVQDVYTTVLHRPADPAGIALWTAFLAKGGTEKQLEAIFYGSGEYFANRGGSTTDGFLTALYQDILNRPIDSAGQQMGRQALANGTSRSALATIILNSSEADQDEIQALFQQYLHRPADTGGLANFTAYLQGGGSLEGVIVNLVGSSEYAQNAGGDANQLYVARLYQDLLNRPADAAGLANFTGLLNSGAASRLQVVQAILASSEYHAQVVQQLFTTYLHRDADKAGLSAFTPLLDNGATDEQVALLLVGSGEYLQQRGGGTNDGFLDAFYHDALGRGVDDAGRKAWDQQMAAGTTPAQVAALIFAGGEYRTHVVQDLYGQFLHRVADPRGVGIYVAQLQAGVHDEAVIASLVSSGEYFTQASG
jgi:hypothetical protein